ncbi:MAG TPA: hypothetical protein VMU34_23515 [Mycobacterium sp.]|nr:hypothetical protein [Mycobacterium sp.]
MLTNPRETGFQAGRPVLTHEQLAERRSPRHVSSQRPEPRRVSGPRSAPAAAGTIDTSARPAHPADVAQARVFETILQGEIAELQHLIASVQRRSLGRREHGIDNVGQPAEAVMRLRGRLAETQRLLDALTARFF